MKFISHRGNLMGVTPALENHPNYIKTALDEGYDVEIDIWWKNNEFYLGHDGPMYKMPLTFLKDSRLWFHCKDIESLYQIRNYFVKYFWHQTDDVTLTSNGLLWTYPGKQLTNSSVAVLPEIAHGGDLWNCYAICTDLVYEYERLYENRNID